MTNDSKLLPVLLCASTALILVTQIFPHISLRVKTISMQLRRNVLDFNTKKILFKEQCSRSPDLHVFHSWFFYYQIETCATFSLKNSLWKFSNPAGKQGCNFRHFSGKTRYARFSFRFSRSNRASSTCSRFNVCTNANLRKRSFKHFCQSLPWGK